MQNPFHLSARGAGLALALACCLWGCAPPAPAPGEFALTQSLARATRLEINVPDADTQAQVQASLRRRPPRALEAQVLLEAQRTELGSDDVRVWVGSASSPGSAAALAALGVQAHPGGFRFLGEDYDSAADGLIASVGDPDRPGSLLVLVLGNDPLRAVAWIEDWSPSPRPRWRTLRDGAPEREGPVGQGGRASSDENADFEALTRQVFASGPGGERGPYDWFAPRGFDPALHSAWFERVDAAAAAADERRLSFLPDPHALPLRLRLFDNAADFARLCRVGALARVHEQAGGHELSLVALPGGADNAPFEVARELLRAQAREPRAAWLLDGAAALCAPDWHGRERWDWLAHLWTAGLLPELSELLREDSALSVHVQLPWRGALLECCEARQGANFASSNWDCASQQMKLPSDDEFRRWLQQRLGARIESDVARRAQRRDAARTRAERRGVCLVPSPAVDGGFGGGFGAADCVRSLEQLREMGANSVALSWCSSIEAGAPRSFGDGPAAWTQADDAALLHALAAARRLGMNVLLLPQLVATENGGWAGQVLLNSADNQRFLFEGWQRFLLHLGLLAELADVDVLSIGGEAPDAAFTRQVEGNRRSWPQLAAQRAQFDALIDGARRSFSGGLTYASRWDGEAAGIEFWSQLDFLGQNVFVPYGNPAAPSAPDSVQFGLALNASFRRVSALAEQQGVRALVCGVGISSTQDAWMEPWRARGALDLDLQKRFYQGLVRALQVGGEGQAWPAGIFCWSWASDPRAGGLSDRGFSPQNKPAQAVLQRALRVP